MTDNEFLESIASDPIVNRDTESIRLRVAHLRKRGLRYVQRKMPWYWRKENDNFSLSTATINLADTLHDFYIPLFFWTTEGEITLWPEKKFRRVYPNPTETGTPDKYIPLTKDNYRFHPAPSGATTIYTSYLYTPPNDSIEIIPKEFHDILEYYVLMAWEGSERGKYTDLFFTELQSMITDARPSVEYDPELLIDDMVLDIEDARDSLNRG